MNVFWRLGGLVAALSLVGCFGLGGGGGGTGGGAGGGGGALLPAPNVSLGLARETFDVFSFIAPSTVATQREQERVVFTNVRDLSCTLTLLPARQSTGTLAQQAIDALLVLGAPRINAFRDETRGTTPLNFQHRVVTADGFTGVTIFGFVFDANGVELSGARTALFDLGDGRVAPLIGLGDCFSADGDTTTDWAFVFHSLRLTGTPTATVLPETRLKGKWSLTAGGVFLGETYAANGRYASTSSAQAHAQVSASAVVDPATTFTGDGTWEAHENRLTTTPAGQAATTRYFRIEEEMSSTAPGGWLERKYELDLAQDGTVYEYALTRDPQ